MKPNICSKNSFHLGNLAAAGAVRFLYWPYFLSFLSRLSFVFRITWGETLMDRNRAPWVIFQDALLIYYSLILSLFILLLFGIMYFLILLRFGIMHFLIPLQYPIDDILIPLQYRIHFPKRSVRQCVRRLRYRSVHFRPDGCFRGFLR